MRTERARGTVLVRRLVAALRSVVQRALLDDAVSVERLEAAFVGSPGDPRARVRFHLKNGAARPALVAVYRPSNPGLVYTLTAPAEVRVGSVGPGWSVEIGPNSSTSIDATTAIPEADVTIGIPSDAPQPVLALDAPRRASPIEVERESVKHCAVLLSPTQSVREPVHAALTARSLSSRVTLPISRFSATVVGARAPTAATPSEQATLARMDSLLGELLRLVEVAPSGSLALLVSEDLGWRDPGVPGLVSLPAAWMAQAEPRDYSLLLLWQLTGVLWGGLIHVHGRGSGHFLFALRAWTVLEFAACLPERLQWEDSSLDNLGKLLTASAAQASDDQALRWYGQATHLTRKLLRSRERHPSPGRLLKQLISETHGCDVTTDWVSRRLNGAGMRLR